MSVEIQDKNYAFGVINANDVLSRLSKLLNVKNDTELAKILGEGRSTIGSWRNRKLPVAAMVDIAAKYGFSLDYLLFGDEKRGDDLIAPVDLSDYFEKEAMEAVVYMAEKHLQKNDLTTDPKDRWQMYEILYNALMEERAKKVARKPESRKKIDLDDLREALNISLGKTTFGVISD